MQCHGDIIMYVSSELDEAVSVLLLSGFSHSCTLHIFLESTVELHLISALRPSFFANFVLDTFRTFISSQTSTPSFAGLTVTNCLFSILIKKW